MYRIRTSTVCVTIAAATVALILLTSATITTSVYAPLSDQVNAPPVSDQANGNGNGNNPVGNQAAPPVSDQANGKEQIQTHAPTITYKSTSSNDMLMHFANVTQPLCGAGICSQSSTNH